MTRDELIAVCLSYPDSYEDYPFHDEPGAPDAWTVMRHLGNRKSFAFIFDREGLCINLKCTPDRSIFLRGYYRGISPGYHMNKEHWNTLKLNMDVPEQELLTLIALSHALTNPPIRRRRYE